MCRGWWGRGLGCQNLGDPGQAACPLWASEYHLTQTHPLDGVEDKHPARAHPSPSPVLGCHRPCLLSSSPEPCATGSVTDGALGTAVMSHVVWPGWPGTALGRVRPVVEFDGECW